MSPQDRVGLPTGCVSGVRCKLEVVHTLFHSLIKFVSGTLLPKIEFPASQITRSLGFSGPPGLLVLQNLAHKGEQRKVTNSKACCPSPPTVDQRRCNDVWVPLAVVPLGLACNWGANSFVILMRDGTGKRDFVVE